MSSCRVHMWLVMRDSSAGELTPLLLFSHSRSKPAFKTCTATMEALRLNIFQPNLWRSSSTFVVVS